MVLKCKICGGDMDISADMMIGTCQYCGTTITLPRVDSDKKVRLFNRASEQLRSCSFDKAFFTFQSIVDEDPEEAEGYWGMLLSEYGIEYVDDASGKKVPTCHRTTVNPVTNSAYYKQTMDCADADRKMLYMEEGELLDSIQKRILAISSKEDPYDVFICYKETDAFGERTQDSVLAQSVYQELTREGMRVFFSRISLEDKIGQNYEPFIYAALSSARVMIHVTTSEENSKSPWVANEWKRYLSFMEKDPTKVLVPAYSQITAYELPNEMTALQGQNLDKLGAVQDLVHAVEKIVRSDRDAILKRQKEKELEELKANVRDNQSKSKRTTRALALAGTILYSMFWILFFPSAADIVPVNGPLTWVYLETIPHGHPELLLPFYVPLWCFMICSMVGLVFNVFQGGASKAALWLHTISAAGVLTTFLVLQQVFGYRPGLNFTYTLYAACQGIILLFTNMMAFQKKKILRTAISALVTVAMVAYFVLEATP